MSEIIEDKATTNRVSASVNAAVSIESPLHYFLGKFSGMAQAKKGAVGLVVEEAGLRGHLNLRGNPQSELFTAGVEQVLGVTLPLSPGTFETNGDNSIYWLGPNEWLLIVPGGSEGRTETALRQAISGHIAIVDISGGQTLINLSGEAVATVLKKSSGYDFHPRHFGPGRCVQTTLAKATALVSKKADGSFDLVIRRSFADYLASWLLDAGREFGCRIETGQR
jgi:sarcosine oxidase subunit gamma